MVQVNIIKKIGKYSLNQIQNVMVVFMRLFGLIDYPVPPNSSMRKTSSCSIRHYYDSGLRTSMPIATCALYENVKLNEQIRILDFGCGVGRQLLHFTRYFSNPDYYACDIDDTSIDFIAKFYPNVKSYTSSFHPPLNYEDNFFDMIYSVSIFSHLCLEDQQIWLAELARITKPGGICLLTTEGLTAVKSLTQDFETEEHRLFDDLERCGYLYKEYEYLKDSIKDQNTLRVTSLAVGVDGSYGNTVMSPNYIKKEWNSSFFEVINIVEGIIDCRQDLIILRRR